MSDAQAKDRIRVAVVTPEGAAFEGLARQVVVPAFDGEWAFLPGHAPFVALLGVGELRVTPDAGGVPERFYLAGGVVQVADDEVVVLAEAVRRASALDPAAARQELADSLARPAVGDEAIDARLAAEDKARARIRVAESARAGSR